jgi:hypothetical protein
MADTEPVTHNDTPAARNSETSLQGVSRDAPEERTSDRRQTRDPLAELVTRLDAIRPLIADRNPRLATTIERLAAPGDHADYVSRLHYPSHAAQALQDTERLVGRIDTDPALREELSRLATSTPGLGNERLQKLLDLTPALADQGLVNKIRDTAADVAKFSDQKSQAVENHINALGFDVAIAPRRDPQSIQSAHDDRPTPAAALVLVENALNLRRDPKGSPSVPDPAEPARETAGTTTRSPGSAPGEDDAHARAANEMAAFGPDPGHKGQASIAPTAGSDAQPDQPGPATKSSTPTADKSASAADQQAGSVKPTDTESPIGARTAPANSAPPPRESDQSKHGSEKPEQAADPDPNKPGPVVFSGAAGAAATALAALTSAAETPDDHTRALRRSPADDQTRNRAAPEQPQRNANTPRANGEPNSERLDPFRPSTPGGIFSNIFAAITPSGQERARGATNAQAPRDPQTADPRYADLNQRSATFEVKQQGRRDAQAIEAAEHAGQAALVALKALENGPAEKILKRIQDAAENTPGGSEKVLEGMHDGGPFGDLRQAFKGALDADKKLFAAFEKAEGALASYAGQRHEIAPLIRSHQDAHTLSKKFEELDRNIGEAAWTIPGTENGKSMFQKLSDGAGQVFEKIAGALRGALGAQASAAASARPAPGP